MFLRNLRPASRGVESQYTIVCIPLAGMVSSADIESTISLYVKGVSDSFMTTVIMEPSLFTKDVLCKILRLLVVLTRLAFGRMNLEKWPI